MEYELKTNVSADGIITQRLICDQVQELSRWACDTREEAIKQALISLGWTPPKHITKSFNNNCCIGESKMRLSIIRENGFNNVEVEVAGAKMSLGLLNRSGSLELAKDLLYAAVELFPPEHGKYDLAEKVLAAVREDL